MSRKPTKEPLPTVEAVQEIFRQARERERGVSPEYRLWVNPERTILFRLWNSGSAELAVRPTSDHTWGPPVTLDEYGGEAR